MAFTPLLFLFLVVFLAVAAVVLSRRCQLRERRRRHIVTRAVCAAFGLGILVTVGIATRRDVRAILTPLDRPVLNTRVPAVGLDELSGDLEPGAKKTLDSASMMLHTVVIDDTTRAPLAVDEKVFEWRTSDPLMAEGDLDVNGVTAHYSLEIDELSAVRSRDEDVWHLEARGERRFRYGGPHSSGSSSGGISLHRGVGYLGAVEYGRVARVNPFSTVRRSVAGTLHVVQFLDLLGPDAATRMTTLDRLLADRRDEYTRLIEKRNDSHAWVRNMSPVLDSTAPPGLKLAVHLGLVSLLLVLAAGLLGQLFVRRGLATAGALLLVVLYAAQLEHIVSRACRVQLLNGDAPVEVRLATCTQLSRPFFFASTARQGLETLLDQPNVPAELQRRAREGLLDLVPLCPADDERLDLNCESVCTWQKGQAAWCSVVRVREGARARMVLLMPGLIHPTPRLRRLIRAGINRELDGRVVYAGETLALEPLGDKNFFELLAYPHSGGDVSQFPEWERLVAPRLFERRVR